MIFTRDALDFSSPFIRFCRRLENSVRSEHSKRRRRALEIKRNREDREDWGVVQMAEQQMTDRERIERLEELVRRLASTCYYGADNPDGQYRHELYEIMRDALMTALSAGKP